MAISDRLIEDAFRDMTRYGLITHWKMLVISLSSSITDGDLEDIKQANRDSLKEQCFQSLKCWRNKDCQEKTTLEILKALRKGLADFQLNKAAGILHYCRACSRPPAMTFTCK